MLVENCSEALSGRKKQRKLQRASARGASIRAVFFPRVSENSLQCRCPPPSIRLRKTLFPFSLSLSLFPLLPPASPFPPFFLLLPPRTRRLTSIPPPNFLPRRKKKSQGLAFFFKKKKKLAVLPFSSSFFFSLFSAIAAKLKPFAMAPPAPGSGSGHWPAAVAAPGAWQGAGDVQVRAGFYFRDERFFEAFFFFFFRAARHSALKAKGKKA